MAARAAAAEAANSPTALSMSAPTGTAGEITLLTQHAG
jgi:hypothetical protein